MNALSELRQRRRVWPVDSTRASAGAAWNSIGADTVTFSAGRDSYPLTLHEGLLGVLLQ